MKSGNHFAHIHSCKEIENFRLIPESISKAIEDRLKESNSRTGKLISFDVDVNEVLSEISDSFKYKTQAQLQSHRLKYEKSINHRNDESSIIEAILKEFELQWMNLKERLKILPGKEFLSALNVQLQKDYKVTITAANIINSLSKSTVPEELKILINEIENFRKLPIPENGV